MSDRKPTWNYILNDIAFSSLIVKCLYSEYSSSQDKYDLEYQIRLMQEEEDKLQKEIERLNNIIKEVREYIEKHTAMFKNGNMLVDINVDELLEILNKGE